MKLVHALILSFLLLTTLPLSAQGILPRAEVKLDQALQQYPLTGRDVLIVILDRGIDYRHPDFIDSQGHTRIKYIYDMLDPSGAQAPNNTYGIGTIFDSTQINQALAQQAAPLTNDRGGHGTATASIAGGNGNAVAGNDFQGVAPHAKFLIIKITHDFFPAFGNQAGQAGFFNPDYLPVALDFAHDKIMEIGLPSVALMNIGSIGGPTDGTSEISRAINDYVDLGHPFVCGVGDDGGADNHASGDVPANQSIELLVEKGEVGFLRLDLWYPESGRLDVEIERPNGASLGPYPAPANRSDAADQNLGDIFVGHRGADVEFFRATSDRRELLIDFSGATGTYKLTLTNRTHTRIPFHATLNPSTFSNNNRLGSFVVPGYAINDYTSATSAITPGDYVVDNSWTDLGGIPRAITGQGEAGELWLGSSEGPTHDGRRGIDFVTPGEVCFAAYQADTWYHQASSNLVQGGDGLYGIQNAVSAAAPLATGIIALMLELNPSLTPSEIKDILHQSSEADAFTGPTPNPTWGYGKLNAQKALDQTAQTVDVEDAILASIKVGPNPFRDILNIHLDQPSTEIQRVSIWDTQGRLCWEAESLEGSQISLAQLPAGIFWIQVHIRMGYYTQKVVRLP
ncbi:MAG: S8 family serine peptidase [Bacteroidota bacterium]